MFTIVISGIFVESFVKTTQPDYDLIAYHAVSTAVQYSALKYNGDISYWKVFVNGNWRHTYCHSNIVDDCWSVSTSTPAGTAKIVMIGQVATGTIAIKTYYIKYYIGISPNTATTYNGLIGNDVINNVDTSYEPFGDDLVDWVNYINAN